MNRARRSLFDTTRPDLIAAAGAALKDRAGALFAALQDPGVLGANGAHDRVIADPGCWERAGRPESWLVWDPRKRAGPLVGAAYGVGLALPVSQPGLAKVGSTPLVWALGTTDTWVADGPLVLRQWALWPPLGVIGVSVPDQSGAVEDSDSDPTRKLWAGLWRSLDLELWEALGGDAWSVLSAMDHAALRAKAQPVGIVLG